MARLTDVDALFKDITKRYCENCDRRKGIKNGVMKTLYEIGEAPCRACAIDDMKDELDNAPTVDAVEVVYCKDCIYFDDCECRLEEDVQGIRRMVALKDYCSFGVRK